MALQTCTVLSPIVHGKIMNEIETIVNELWRYSTLGPTLFHCDVTISCKDFKRKQTIGLDKFTIFANLF